MDSFRYLSEVNAFDTLRASAIEAANAKDEEKQMILDTVSGTVEAPLGLSLIGKTLESDAFKNAIKSKINTGNEDLDSTLKNIVDGENPIDEISGLLTRQAGNIKTGVQEGILPLFRNRTVDPNEGATELSTMQDTSQVNDTRVNPTFEDVQQDAVDNAVENVTDNLPEGAGGYVDLARSIMQNGVVRNAPITEAFENGVSRTASDTVGELSNAVNTLGDRISSFASSQAQGLEDITDSTLSSAREMAGGLLDRAQGGIQSLMESGQNLVGNASDSVVGGLTRAAGNLVPEGTEGLMNTITSAVTGGTEAAGEGASGALDTALGVIDAISDADPITAILGGILTGGIGLIATFADLFKHHHSQPNLSDLPMPVMQSGV